MRTKITISLLLLIACATTASATLAPACPGSTNDSGSIAYSVFTASGFACQQQDKAYSNFAVSGLPTQSSLRLFYQPISGFDIHTLTFTGNLSTPFTVSYTVTVDPSISPNVYIDRISGDLQNPSLVGNPTNTTSVVALAGTGGGNIVSTGAGGGTPLIVNGTSFRVTDTYTPAGGAATSVGNAFREVVTVVPEPGTMALTGLSFLLVGAVSRYRLRRN